MVRGRYPLSAWNRFYPVFFIRIKIMTEKAKLFSPSAYMAEMEFEDADGIHRAF